MSAEPIYPLVIEPKETAAIWGGDALVSRFGKPGDSSEKIGESWECWDQNRIANGALAGATIADARARMGSALLGNIDPNRIFPILTKIIDARDWLSVQVHPNDAYADRVEHQQNGKTECWYVLDAQPGAELVLGWTANTSREEYERRVADGTLGEILRRVPVHAGDAFYLPAGSLHAIGAGVIIFETQQASDLTYRIFDWNRTGADGKPRELHVRKAGDVLDYHQGTRGAVEQLPYRLDGMDATAIIADRRFSVSKVVAKSEPGSIPTDDRPLIIMPLGRALEVCAGDERARLNPYQTALIPAASEWCTVTAIDGNSTEFMLVTPPPHAETLAVRLLASGVDQDRIDRFMAQFS